MWPPPLPQPLVARLSPGGRAQLFRILHRQVEGVALALDQEAGDAVFFHLGDGLPIFFNRADDLAVHFQNQVSRPDAGISRGAAGLHLDHHHPLVVPEAELLGQSRGQVLHLQTQRGFLGRPFFFGLGLLVHR